MLAPFIGSFLGVVVMRADAPRTILFGRSICDGCGAVLGPRDLVPVASWIALKGRCRHCAHALGAFYPVIEIAAVIIALWSASVAEGAPMWAGDVLGWTLLALAAIDLRSYLLPDFLTLPLMLAGLIATAIFASDMLAANAIGAAAGFAFIVALRALYRLVRGREGIGLADAKLMAAAGAWIGWTGLPSVLLVASISGLAFALLRAARKGTLSALERIPFGPFLCLGIWIVWLYGPLTLT